MRSLSLLYLDNKTLRDRVLYILIETTHRLKRICYLCDFILLIYTYALYNIYINDLNYFAYGEVGMILILGFIQNRVVAPKGNFIIKIAIEASFTPEYIHLKTAAFKGPLWFKKESADVRLNRAKAAVQEIPNPYPNIFKLNSPLIKLSDGKQDIYILNQYFNWRIADELKEH
jgi:hypothetical protein